MTDDRKNRASSIPIGSMSPVADSIDFFYRKSPGYRAIHADGFYGGITPRGLVQVSFFNERAPIPRHVRRPIVGQDGSRVTAGPEETLEGLVGIVRNVEETIFMDVTTAQEFFLWFKTALATAESSLNLPSDQRVAGDLDSGEK
ncbi:MAG: hypothetical protein JOY99_01390 [Sphingomonadaceae bacterium]|nr:hypothetical protein [Sphingomonadaceae bacterium]